MNGVEVHNAGIGFTNDRGSVEHDVPANRHLSQLVCKVLRYGSLPPRWSPRHLAAAMVDRRQADLMSRLLHNLKGH